MFSASCRWKVGRSFEICKTFLEFYNKTLFSQTTETAGDYKNVKKKKKKKKRKEKEEKKTKGTKIIQQIEKMCPAWFKFLEYLEIQSWFKRWGGVCAPASDTCSSTTTANMFLKKVYTSSFQINLTYQDLWRLVWGVVLDCKAPEKFCGLRLFTWLFHQHEQEMTDTKSFWSELIL